MDFIATAGFGIEAVLARELETLGYEARTLRPGWVGFQGGIDALVKANIHLRTADRVLVRMGTFRAEDFGVLFDATSAIAWEEWIPPDGRFPVNGRSLKSALSSVPACQKIVKKAIVERLRRAHAVAELPESGGTYTVEVALLDDEATLTLDTSGPGLHKRGYRKLVGKAPLRETLAAALVLLSFWTPRRPLLDPFCGTGTIPIEAALLGRRIAPGLNRTFAAEEWPGVPPRVWTEVREEAQALVVPNLDVPILGNDIDEKALSLARYHAKEAGVQGDIQFSVRPFADQGSPRDYGCIITNPPYGLRVGEDREMETLYRMFPEVLRRFKTWSHYILTAIPDFEARIGQTADRRRKLYNGRIACTYFQFHGPRPTAKTSAAEPDAAMPDPRDAAEEIKPAFGGLTEKGAEQGALFRTRLLKRARHLRRWPTRRGITCFRVYERDIPEIPLVVDRYEDCLHITEYERPHDRTPAEHADWLDLMARTAANALEVDPKRVFLKRRQRQRGKKQHERLAEENRTFIVHEGGLKFEVNLSDYVDTGLFLDHRQTRGMVRDQAGGKRFLNLFAYTGAFSVYAAAGGASETTTVDWSNTYLDWARRNMVLNGFTGANHRFVRADARSFLDEDRREYDLAVVDPPTFSNRTGVDEIWDIQKDYSRLLADLLARMSPGGVVYFSTNSRRFKFDPAVFSNAATWEISRQTVPEDFRNKRIHRCWRLIKKTDDATHPDPE